MPIQIYIGKVYFECQNMNFNFWPCLAIAKYGFYYFSPIRVPNIYLETWFLACILGTVSCITYIPVFWKFSKLSELSKIFVKKIIFEILGVKNQKIQILTKNVVRPINSECFLSLTFSSVFKTVDVTALPVNLCFDIWWWPVWPLMTSSDLIFDLTQKMTEGNPIWILTSFRLPFEIWKSVQ